MSPRPFTKYFTYSEEDVAWGCYGTTAGFARVTPHEPYPPRPEDHPPQYSRNWDQGRRLREYAVVYITRGAGTLRLEEAEYALAEGSAFIIRPDAEHWYAPDPETGWDEYWIGFRGAAIESIVDSGFLDTEKPVMDVGVHTDIVTAFREIFDLSETEKPGYQLQVGALVLRILAELISYRKAAAQPDASERLIDKAKSVFAAHVTESLSVDDVAEELGLSSAVFRSMFRDYTGMTPYQYFLHLKINRSKELLSDPALSVKEIAYLLSFTDPYHFSRLFKSKTGVAPSHWSGTARTDSETE